MCVWGGGGGVGGGRMWEMMFMCVNVCFGFNSFICEEVHIFTTLNRNDKSSNKLTLILCPVNLQESRYLQWWTIMSKIYISFVHNRQVVFYSVYIGKGYPKNQRKNSKRR